MFLVKVFHDNGWAGIAGEPTAALG